MEANSSEHMLICGRLDCALAKAVSTRVSRVLGRAERGRVSGVSVSSVVNVTNGKVGQGTAETGHLPVYQAPAEGHRALCEVDLLLLLSYRQQTSS